MLVEGLKSSHVCMCAGPTGSRIPPTAFAVISEDGEQKVVEMLTERVIVNVPQGPSELPLISLPLVDYQEVGKHV